MSNSRTRTDSRSWLRLAGLGLAWLVGLALLLTAIAAAWAWSNRYALIERQAITYLDTLGIKADLSIRSADGTAADIRNIRLAYEDEPFLTIDRLQASYQWRDLLGGQVEGLIFMGLDAEITIDEQGQIIDGWRPPASGGETAFPADGIKIEDGTIRLNTPYGTLPLSGQAEFFNPDRFTFDGNLARTTLGQNDIRATVSGPLSVERNRGPIRVSTPQTELSLTHPSGTLSDTSLILNTRITPDGPSFEGRISLVGGRFETEAGIAADIDTIVLDGSWQDGIVRATADTRLTQLRVTERDRRETLARTLSLTNILEPLPVAQNFAPQLVDPTRDILAGSTLAARVSIYADDRNRRLNLREPLQLSTPRTVLRLDATETEPLYHFVTGRDSYALNTRLSLSRPVPLKIEPLGLTIRSENGLTIDGIAEASGQMSTSRSWPSQTQDGRPARLGPLSVMFDYAAPETAPSRMVLRGLANYDGDIPGGYIENMVAGGRMVAELNDGRTRIDFTPDRRLSFSELETTSDWRIEDFDGTLVPKSPIYQRNRAGIATIQTGLSDAHFIAVRPETDADDTAILNMRVDQADIVGTVRTLTQDWQIDFSNVALQSETFPVENTDLVLPSGSAEIGLSSDTPLAFKLDTPGSTFRTPLYVVRDMALGASGTIDQYELNFQQGRIRMLPQTQDAISLPPLPLSGTLEFADGQFTGQAQTFLPRVPDNPIQIDFRMVDGQGEAKVRIDALQFRPGGLQPQDLATAMRGKIAGVEGTVNADLDILFGGDTPLSGSGTVDIVDMSLGTAPGPVSGLSGQIELTSLFPVATAPDQVLRIASFDPGFPLENGILTYVLVPDGFDVREALFPLGDGQVSFDPFTWTYGAEENRVTLRVSGVEIGEFLDGIGEGRLSATGELTGTIPVVVRGLDVLVDQGRLQVENGGTIRYSPEDVSEALQNEYATMAIEALQNFNYDALFLEIDGPLDGDVRLGLKFTGSNPDVLFAVPFQFDVSVEGELFNIARSLNPNGLQERVVSNVVAQQQDAAVNAEGETD